MLWSNDSSQNRVSTDQYHLTVWRAQSLTHGADAVFSDLRWSSVISFQPIASSYLSQERNFKTNRDRLKKSVAPPRGPTPLMPIYIPLFTKKRIPFVYLLLTHGTPFTYLFNNFASLLTDVNALSFKWQPITKIERFLDFIRPWNSSVSPLHLLGPFTDPNDRFPYLFVYFNE